MTELEKIELEIEHLTFAIRFRTTRLRESQGEVDEERAERLIREDQEKRAELQKRAEELRKGTK